MLMNGLLDNILQYTISLPLLTIIVTNFCDNIYL